MAQMIIALSLLVIGCAVLGIYHPDLFINICKIVGHEFFWTHTKDSGRDLELNYSCRRCDETATYLLSDSLEDEAHI